ncbi:hypothetical protein GGI42DRAFT_94088 [Trichoderma sp. SZMC 28013]
MVTHSTTNLPLIGLTLGEQTGPRIFQWIWSYVLGCGVDHLINPQLEGTQKGKNIQQPVFAGGHPPNY